MRPKPGLVRFLSILKMEGVWMYVATATDRPLAEAALKTAGIDGFFRGMITSREAGQTKREGPEIYERALRRLRSNKKTPPIKASTATPHIPTKFSKKWPLSEMTEAIFLSSPCRLSQYIA